MGEFAKIAEIGVTTADGRTVDQIYVDQYKTQRTPTIEDLIDSYKRTAFTCANINANGCACKDIKLFVKSKDSDTPTVLRTQPVDEDSEQFVRDTFDILDNEIVEEVIEHPALMLLRKVNKEPFLHEYNLKALTFLFMDVTSCAYWWIIRDERLGIPVAIWLLPSQYVTPRKQSNSDKIVDFYEFTNGDITRNYSVDEIIQFIPLGLNNPYLEGTGANRASYEATLLANKLASMTTNMLDNEGRPDLAYIPKEGIGADAAKNLERRLNLKYSQGRSGGWHVVDEPADIQPINYPPRDIARLDINMHARDEICNTFGVPIAFLDNRNISRETIFGALTHHAIFGILPRLKIFCSVLNKRLIPFYDNTDRLFFGFDDPVPEDRQAKLQENAQLVMNGIKTPAEARKDYKLPKSDDPEADKLQRINTPGDSGNIPRQESRDSGEAER